MLWLLMLDAFFVWSAVFLAAQRGRDPVGWGALAFLFGPFAVVVIGLSRPAVSLPSTTPGEEPRDAASTAVLRAVHAPAKACPHCSVVVPAAQLLDHVRLEHPSLSF